MGDVLGLFDYEGYQLGNTSELLQPHRRSRRAADPPARRKVHLLTCSLPVTPAASAAGFFPDSLTIPVEVCRDTKAEVGRHPSSRLFPCLGTGGLPLHSCR